MVSTMARKDTKLEPEGAEFLVLGNLLIHGIATYKTYTNMAGYDLVAVNPERNTSAKIQVKSRWATGAGGFLIKNFDCDFVVVVLLNRGSKSGKKAVLPPKFYVLTADQARRAVRGGNWSKVLFRDIPDMDDYESRWDIISQFLLRDS